MPRDVIYSYQEVPFNCMRNKWQKWNQTGKQTELLVSFRQQKPTLCYIQSSFQEMNIKMIVERESKIVTMIKILALLILIYLVMLLSFFNFRKEVDKLKDGLR